jgi:List-Bact-rpt repeat protein/ASPM-SPD-2-Hydin domain-containing protein/BACON domain-containing protein
MPKIDIKYIRMEAGRVLLMILAGCIIALSAASAQGNVFLTTNIIPAGKGQVELDPEQPVDGYAPSTVVTLTAVDSDPCYQFSHWTGDASGEDAVITVVMDESKTVNANFAPGIFDVSISSLSQFVIAGSPAADQALLIGSTGGNCFTWSLETTEDWIYISKKSGTGDDSVTVNIISSKVPCQGTHVGFIRLRSVNSDPEQILIPVLLRVGAEEVTANVTGSPTAISCQDYAPDVITVTIINNSASQIVFANPPNFGEGFVLKNPDVFPMVLEDNTQSPLNQAEMFIRFEPTPEQAGAISSQIKMIANNCGRQVYFELNATRIKPTAIVNVTELDFGIINNCSVDPLPVRTIRLRNTYVENARLWYKIPQGFTLVSAPNAVAGGSTISIELRAERDGPAIIDSLIEIEVDYDICSEIIRVKLTGTRQSPSFYAETDQGSGVLTNVEFDTTCLGSTDTKTVRVINDGNSTLNFRTALSNPDYFSVDSPTFTVAAGATHILTLTFSPEIGGSFSTELLIEADQCDLSETNTLFGRTFEEVLLSADVTPSQITLSNCEAEGVFTLTIDNTDTETATFTGPPATLPSGFEWDATITYPVVIPAGEQFSTEVYFRPPAGVGGVFGDTVNWFGEPCGTKASFFLQGERILPTYAVSPTDINLGMVVNCDGDPQGFTEDFVFTNTSGIDMVVLPQSVPDGIALLIDVAEFPPAGVTVAGGDTLVVTVKAIDRDPGTIAEMITFDVVAGEAGACSSTFDINVTGSWYTPSFEVVIESEGDNEWDPLCVGTSLSKRFAIRNTGNIQIEVKSAGFGGGPFQLENLPFSVILNPDEERLFQVRFTPDARGPATATLEFTETICNTTATLDVSGSGVEPQLEIASISPDMPMTILSCEPDGNRQITVTVSNPSEDPLTLRDLFLPDGFTLSSTIAFPISLDAAETFELLIMFNGTELGNYGGTATLFAEECDLSVDFDLQVIVSSSSYTLSDTQYDFGDIRICPDGKVFPEDLNNLSQSIEISNTGTTSMSVNATFSLPHPNVSLTSPAVVPFNVAPGQTKFLTVVIAPPFTNMTDISAALRIVSSRDTICSVEPTIIPITANISRVNFGFTRDSIIATADLGQDSLKIWALVQNTGEGDITLNLDLNGAGNFYLGSDPVITVEEGNVDSICVVFDPSQIGSFSTRLIANDAVCNTSDEMRIVVTILQGGVVLMGNATEGQPLTLTARPGDEIEIPVYLNESLNLNQANFPFELGQIELEFDMEFNVFDLAPMSIQGVSVQSATFSRTDPNTIHVVLKDSAFKAGHLATITTEVLLGTATSTQWSFMNPEFTPLVAFVDLDNNATGTLNLEPRNGFTTRRDLGIPWLEGPKPNPVSSASGQTATVEYNIVEDGHVVLRLYNELGMQVALLNDGWMQKGVHSVRINSNRLPNGIYHIIMSAGSFHSSKKLILGR